MAILYCNATASGDRAFPLSACSAHHINSTLEVVIEANFRA